MNRLRCIVAALLLLAGVGATNAEAQGNRYRLLDPSAAKLVVSLDELAHIHPHVAEEPRTRELDLLLDRLAVPVELDGDPSPRPVPVVHPGFQDEGAHEDIVVAPILRF